MKKSLVTTLILCSNFLIHAQFSVGIKSGLHLANIEMQGIAAGLEAFSDPIISPMIDAIAEYKFRPCQCQNRCQLYEQRIGNGPIFVERQYKHSLETLKPDFLEDLNLKNKDFSVGIGYAKPF